METEMVGSSSRCLKGRRSRYPGPWGQNQEHSQPAAETQPQQPGAGARQSAVGMQDGRSRPRGQGGHHGLRPTQG